MIKFVWNEFKIFCMKFEIGLNCGKKGLKKGYVERLKS